jgi:hypothetical protein
VEFGMAATLSDIQEVPMTRIALFIFSGILLTICSLAADTVNIGVLSFNNLNPGGGGSPGINDYEVDNLTGALFGLPPDFPVADSITLGGAQVTLFPSGGGSSQVVSLGDLAPGVYTPDGLQFLDTSQFAEATLQATLSQTSFALSDGTTFRADSGAIDATLLPSSGPVLQPGQDFVVLSVSGEVSAIPEARHTGLFPVVLIVGLLTHRVKHPKPHFRRLKAVMPFN